MCKFCDRLDAIIYFDKQEKELGREYTAAIVTRSWRKDQGKRCSSRSVSFKNKGIGFDLNFCTECGKKLKRQGKDSVVLESGEVIRCSLKGEGEAAGRGFVSHFSTCPNANKHRKERS